MLIVKKSHANVERHDRIAGYIPPSRKKKFEKNTSWNKKPKSRATQLLDLEKKNRYKEHDQTMSQLANCI